MPCRNSPSHALLITIPVECSLNAAHVAKPPEPFSLALVVPFLKASLRLAVWRDIDDLPVGPRK